MSEYYIQVPPDSTGKSIRHSIQIEIDYINPISPGAESFAKGEIVVFAQSGMIGTVGLDHYAGGVQHLEPHVHLLLTHGSPESIIAGENMVVSGQVRAEATVTTRLFYIPVVQIIGGDNPVHSQSIDRRGAATVTFAEGEPMFDAYGKSQVSQSALIGQYSFNYTGVDHNYSDVETFAATVTHDQPDSCMVLTNPTTTGAVSSRTTDQYHSYTPGSAQFTEITMRTGDTGKADVRRRWGYFNEENGLFFELNGTTLSVVGRSNASGSVVDMVIPQSQWNTDRVDGAGGVFNPSGETLDVSKNNVYWMDFQWRTGRIRFGVKIGERSRIICHNGNNSNQALMTPRTGNLPVRVEQENTGTAGSISQLRWYSAAVQCEGTFSPHLHRFAFAPAAEAAITNTLVPMFSIRPKATFGGLTNRSVIVPVHMSMTCFDQTTFSTPERLVVEVYSNPVLTGDTWPEQVHANSVAEIDYTATSFTGGELVGTLVVSGALDLSLTEFFDYLAENIKNKHNGTQQHYTFAVRTLRTGVTADVFGTITWEELLI